MRARVWIGEEIHVLVRLRGIDAPELKGRCKAEREAARRASNLLARLLGDGPLTLSDIGGGKYFGRVLADVTTTDGRDPAARLLAAGLARPYAGGRRAGWCATADAAR
ncbi:MAG: thermonuclease family protein [Hyphomicrobiales bacterium]